MKKADSIFKFIFRILLILFLLSLLSCSRPLNPVERLELKQERKEERKVIVGILVFGAFTTWTIENTYQR